VLDFVEIVGLSNLYILVNLGDKYKLKIKREEKVGVFKVENCSIKERRNRLGTTKTAMKRNPKKKE